MKNIRVMKFNIFRLFSLFAAIVLLQTACVDDEFDTPPAQYLAEGDRITISEIKALFADSGSYLNDEVQIAYQFKDSLTLQGTITMDDKNGNIYRTVYIQDETGGIAIFLENSGGLYQGDSLRISLTDLVVMQYQNLYQINALDGNGVNIDETVVKLDVLKERKPESASISDILSQKNYYQSRLVKLENVQFVADDTSKTFANAEEKITENRNLEDSLGSNILVRTSGYANFADESVPDSSGSLVAVVGQYRDDMQLYIRSYEEIEMDQPRFGTGGSTGEPVDSLFQDFESVADYSDVQLDGWLNYLEAGDRKWQGKTYDSNTYAQASGYNSGLSSMVSWLITPPIIIDKTKYLRFNSAIAYWEHTTDEPLQVMVSTDFDGSNPETATWTEVNVTLPGSSATNYEFMESGNVDLSDYIGQNVFVAFKYTGSDAQSTSAIVDDVYVGESSAGGGGGDVTGAGTFDDPYNVESGITNQGEAGVWVEGYIVGVYETQDESGNDLSDFVPSFEGPFYTNSNIIIADSESETNISNCVVVQLPSGDIRTALNLVDNPGNEGKLVKAYGNLEAYFGEAGLKSLTGYWLDGSGIIPETGFYEEDFTDDISAYSTFNITGTQVWEWDYYDNGCAVMSGYDGGSIPNEDWLIHPLSI